MDSFLRECAMFKVFRTELGTIFFGRRRHHSPCPSVSRHDLSVSRSSRPPGTREREFRGRFLMIRMHQPNMFQKPATLGSQQTRLAGVPK